MSRIDSAAVPRPEAFLLLHVLVVLLAGAIFLGGLGLFVTPVVVLGVIPACDWLLGRRKANPGPEEEAVLARRRGYKLAVWLALPVQVALLVGGGLLVSGGGLSPVQLVDLVLSLGLLSSLLAINAAHELCHRSEKLERALGYLLLATIGYMHWGIEHVQGHHRWVATPRDPVSARRGESFYRFLPRALVGELVSVFGIERARLAKKGGSPLGLENRLLRFTLLQAAILGGIAITFGPLAALAWIGQALVAVTLLQVINYVEHYGLRRRELAPGVYERVTPRHSWNASEKLTNLLLFNLERHADHHAHAARRYQLLRHFDGSPQLPTGYAGMLLLALVPPLWFRLMDPRLDAHRLGGDATGKAA